MLKQGLELVSPNEYLKEKAKMEKEETFRRKYWALWYFINTINLKQGKK